MSVGTLRIIGKGIKTSIDDAFEKFTKGGGNTGRNKKITIQKKDIDKKLSKQKQVDKAKENRAKKQKKTKKVADKKPSVEKLASDAKTKRNIKSNISKAEKVFDQKEYNKKLFDTLKKNQKNKILKNTIKNKTKQSTNLVPAGSLKTIKETVNPKKIKQNFKTVGKPVDKTPKINKPKKQSTALVLKNVPATGKVAYLKKHFGKHWKRYAAGLGLLSAGFLISKDKNVGEGSIIGGGNKDKKPKKDFTPKVKKPTTPEVKIKKLPKAPTKTQKKSRSNIVTSSGKPSSSYDAQFTYDNLKKRGLNPKNFMSPENFKKVKKLKKGTKDKTIGKPMLLKDALNKKFKEKAKLYRGFMSATNIKPTRKRTMVEKIFGGGPDEGYRVKEGQIAKGAARAAKKSMKKQYPKLMKRITKKSEGSKVGLKDLPPKSINPGIHKLPAKAKMNMGFKPMFGGGLIASFYDKPEKTEKYKGNTTSARQVKGYGKAKKKA